MCDKDGILQEAVYLFSYRFKAGSCGHHLICDPGHGLDIIGDGLSGVNQRFIFLNHLRAIKDMNGDLRNPIGGGVGARGFYVDDGVDWLRC